MVVLTYNFLLKINFPIIISWISLTDMGIFMILATMYFGSTSQFSDIPCSVMVDEIAKANVLCDSRSNGRVIFSINVDSSTHILCQKLVYYSPSFNIDHY